MAENIEEPRTIDSLRIDVMTACNSCSGALGIDPYDHEVTCSHRPVIDCVLPRLIRLALKDDTIPEKLPTEWVLRHARVTQQDLIHEEQAAPPAKEQAK